MGKTHKEVNRTNIISGPCRSFTVGEREVGGTQEGVEVEFTNEYEAQTTDEMLDAAYLDKVGTQMVVKTALAEATLENLKLAWALNGDIVENPTEGTETLKIGMDSSVKEMSLEFIGPAPNGKERTYTVYRAVQMSASAHSIKKGEKQVFPVEFRILPDTTKPRGEEYGLIVDRTISE